jgi:hypothetical protein
MKRLLVKAGLVLISGLALHLPAQAQAMPEISPSLKKMLGGLPIADIKDDLKGMVAALKKTNCGAALPNCYSTKTGVLQLYFFTSKGAQQTFLLVINKRQLMPSLLKEKVQKALGGTYLIDPIISISTTDFDLDMVQMPADLQKVVRDSYFNVSTLSFSSGVQLAARADLGGALKLTMETMGVKADKLTLRAAVAIPIPTDLAGGAGAGAGLADALAHSDSFKKAGADALKPEAFVELQFAPGSKLPLTLPPMNLSDATFFLNNEMYFGYKGNASFKGLSDKQILLQFQTPLNPETAVMDLASFSFRMATPASFTMEDAANVMVAMATPDKRLANYGGFLNNIESYKKALLDVTKPLSVFKLTNPNPAPQYRFADSSKPWPNDPKYFNITLVGPQATDAPGPYMNLAGKINILGQNLEWMDASVGLSGLHATSGNALSLKMGPLGKVSLRMESKIDVDKGTQNVSLKGNLDGQIVQVTLAGTKLTIDVNASCINPFEIKSSAKIEATTDLAHLFDLEGGANVDPSKIGGCVGKELEAAYNKIANDINYKKLGGYTASAANAELTKISNAAARQTYENTKNAARNVANSSSNAANNALKAADNVFKGFGKKKKHKKGPDPKFAATVFDWDFYYDYYPELVAQGVDLATHWRDTGFAQGRQGSFEFNATFYIKRYADVQRACSGNLQCALQHWLDFGIDEGRQATWEFSISSYLARYADLRANYPNGDFAGAFEHWYATGIPENRSGTPLQQWNGTLQGPVVVGGGSGQALWNDINSCIDAPISSFKLRYGGSIDAVQFGYHNRGWASVHGNQTNDFTEEVSLPPDEHFTEVWFGGANRVDNITFFTNKGRQFGPYGGGQQTRGYKAEPGESIGCMAGRSGGSIDQLTFISTGPR